MQKLLENKVAVVTERGDLCNHLLDPRQRKMVLGIREQARAELDHDAVRFGEYFLSKLHVRVLAYQNQAGVSRKEEGRQWRLAFLIMSGPWKRLLL